MTLPARPFPAALTAALLAALALLALSAPLAGARRTAPCTGKGHRHSAHAHSCARPHRHASRRAAAEVRKSADRGDATTTHPAKRVAAPGATAPAGRDPGEGCGDEGCEGGEAGEGLTGSPCREGGAATLEEGSFTCPDGDEPACPPGTQTTLTQDETELVCEPAGEEQP